MRVSSPVTGHHQDLHKQLMWRTRRIPSPSGAKSPGAAAPAASHTVSGWEMYFIDSVVPHASHPWRTAPLLVVAARRAPSFKGCPS